MLLQFVETRSYAAEVCGIIFEILLGFTLIAIIIEMRLLRGLRSGLSMHVGVFVFLCIGCLIRMGTVAFFLLRKTNDNADDADAFYNTLQDMLMELGFLPFFAANLLFVSHLLMATLSLDMGLKRSRLTPDIVRKTRASMFILVAIVNCLLFGIALARPDNLEALKLLMAIQLGVHVSVCSVSSALVLMIGINFRTRLGYKWRSQQSRQMAWKLFVAAICCVISFLGRTSLWAAVVIKPDVHPPLYVFLVASTLVDLFPTWSLLIALHAPTYETGSTAVRGSKITRSSLAPAFLFGNIASPPRALGHSTSTASSGSAIDDKLLVRQYSGE